MAPHIDHILGFTLRGKFAHFRKFYTNASSLSYLAPPRTALTGMLASIKLLPRDSYYECLNPSDCLLSTAIVPDFAPRKVMQSVNMLHDTYFSFLNKGSGSSRSMHTQCKMELLVPESGETIAYRVYVAFPGHLENLITLEQKLKSGNLGYGLYLGQRQFRAIACDPVLYTGDQLEYLEQSDCVDSICPREKVEDFQESEGAHVVMEQMPIHMKLVKEKKNQGREPVSVKSIVMERCGRRLYGAFNQCFRVGDRVISFY
jgi:CRISPR-associated protein Cas5h